MEIQKDHIDVNEYELDYWKEILIQHQEMLIKPIKSVGRLEVMGHPNFDWIGTGWIVAEDIVVTNRHVAKEFAHKRGRSFVFNQDIFGRTYEVNIDFREEINSDSEADFTISEVLHIEEESGPDLAFLRIKWQNNNQARSPIPL